MFCLGSNVSLTHNTQAYYKLLKFWCQTFTSTQYQCSTSAKVAVVSQVTRNLVCTVSNIQGGMHSAQLILLEMMNCCFKSTVLHLLYCNVWSGYEQRRYCALPTMHCFQWDILYGLVMLLVTKWVVSDKTYLKIM